MCVAWTINFAFFAVLLLFPWSPSQRHRDRGALKVEKTQVVFILRRKKRELRTWKQTCCRRSVAVCDLRKLCQNIGFYIFKWRSIDLPCPVRKVIVFMQTCSLTICNLRNGGWKEVKTICLRSTGNIIHSQTLEAYCYHVILCIARTRTHPSCICTQTFHQIPFIFNSIAFDSEWHGIKLTK